MALTRAQSQRVADERIAIRAAATPTDVAGAGYGLYTARTSAQMQAWELAGPPAAWYAQLYNTGLFMLAMPDAQSQYVLFVPGGGNPGGETYSVAHLEGGQPPQTTLPKVNALIPDTPVAASMALAGATAQTIGDWVIAQI